MKVLIVNTNDIVGGAARAAYRLHHALLETGINSQMLVQNKTSDDYTVTGPDSKLATGIAKFLPLIDRLPVQKYKDRSKTLFSPAWVSAPGIVDRINSFEPDIVHLHWINNGMLKPKDLEKIDAPIVWSLHDMWAFTGGCHYDEECGKYQTDCGNCPVLGSNKKNDLSEKVFSHKNQSYSKIDSLTVVGLSRWIAECAKKSSLFSETNVINLPNPINTESFKPYSKQKARELLNLPLNKKLVLFGAMSATSDPRKGFNELSEALLKIKSDDTDLIVFGSSRPKVPVNFKQKTHYLGRIYDDVTLRVLYNAADVMVVPSKQENLSNAIMESLACGTPVVGFNIGGNSDMVDHQENGYLAKKEDVTDLANGIDWVLEKSEQEILSANARNKVMDNFDINLISKRYIKLYKSIINNNRKKI